jgi:hypothetical protein
VCFCYAPSLEPRPKFGMVTSEHNDEIDPTFREKFTGMPVEDDATRRHVEFWLQRIEEFVVIDIV